MNQFVKLLSLLLFVSVSNAQTDQLKGFKDYYPISVRPEASIGLGNNPYEQILLEATPVVYYGFYNDMRRSLNQDTITSGDAVYLSFQPHFRIYNEESKPVKTPSYKVLIGWQRIIKTDDDNFLTAAIESGHFSNGQAGSAFSTEFEDNSEESIAIYDRITDDTDLAALLNRSTGNFSTNLTRFSFNYRLNTFNEDNIPQKIHSMTATYQLYHDKFMGLIDFGGYNPQDIDIYGRHKFELGYEFTSHLKKMRFTLSQQFDYTIGSHPSSVPYRSVTTGILYPWDNDLGFFTKFSFGRDNYNYRFVDNFPRFTVGVTWDWFTPFVIKPKKLQLDPNELENKNQG
ncbi:hypothetical protein [Nonlabens ulvanivorans]|nr:hypothetical protein [Nonlabens ulvanivorans]PRX13472.1 hypothetical protein LY02_01714 [Nonlabens ulvanivorans]WOI23733.1 hypothetical protein R1T42_04580 [Nonlabens ulvanivorans]